MPTSQGRQGSPGACRSQEAGRIPPEPPDGVQASRHLDFGLWPPDLGDNTFLQV